MKEFSVSHVQRTRIPTGRRGSDVRVDRYLLVSDPSSVPVRQVEATRFSRDGQSRWLGAAPDQIDAVGQRLQSGFAALLPASMVKTSIQPWMRGVSEYGLPDLDSLGRILSLLEIASATLADLGTWDAPVHFSVLLGGEESPHRQGAVRRSSGCRVPITWYSTISSWWVTDCSVRWPLPS